MTTGRRHRHSPGRRRLFRIVAAVLRAAGIREGMVAGFSGGADSTVLLHVLADLANRFPDQFHPVVAAHLDHALDPDSRRAAQLAATTAAALGVEFVTARCDVAAAARRGGRSLEDAGRRARLDFLAETAHARGIRSVVLGHNRSDQAETVLLRLARGAGCLGLSGIPAGREDARGVTLVRPLLTISREEIRNLARAEGWSFYRDPSNASERHARNRIRRRVLPLLREALNPAIESALARAAELLREDEAFLAAAARQRFRELADVRTASPAVAVSLPARRVAALPPALARRLVREALLTVRGHLLRIELAHVDAVLEVARNGRGGARLCLPAATARIEQGRLIFARNPNAPTGNPEPAGAFPIAGTGGGANDESGTAPPV